MSHPQNATRANESRADRIEDLDLAVASLRRAVQGGDRIRIETACVRVMREVNSAIGTGGEDREEICAVVNLIQRRVERFVTERQRLFLVPLVDAIDKMCEVAERD